MQWYLISEFGELNLNIQTLDKISHQKRDLRSQILVHRERADGRNLDSTTRYLDNHTSAYPTTDSGRAFSQEGWASLNALCNILTLEDDETVDWMAPIWGFELGGNNVSSAGKGILSGIITTLLIFIQKKRNTAWELWVYRKVWETQNSHQVSNKEPLSIGGPASFKVSANLLEMLCTLYLHSRTSPRLAGWSLRPSSALPSSSLTINQTVYYISILVPFSSFSRL